jgi:DNA-binding NarL/FixJ family response regulator
MNSETENLSNRELQVAMLMAHGCPSKEIADRLHITKSTVEKHKNSIYYKLKVCSGIDVTKWLMQHLYIKPEEWCKVRQVINHAEPQKAKIKPKGHQ